MTYISTPERGTIHNPAEGRAAKKGTIVVNGYGDPWQKREDGLWHLGETRITSDMLFRGAPPSGRPIIWNDGDFGIGVGY